MRAVGIVRVSERRGREGESFASPREQRDLMIAACAREGGELVATFEEIDVSGGTPLAKRHGLLAAVEAIETDQADVVMVAYFDRLVRSLVVQSEVVQRVEAAGGRVLALDFGEVTEATAAQWLSGTVIGAMSEYYRRSVRERSGAAQARAVARGVLPFPNVPPGYTRSASGVLEPSEDAPVVAEAFTLRSQGATIREIRAFLGLRGIRRSYNGVQAMLTSRLYLGEIHFGALSNLQAHEAIVSRDVWKAAQRAPRGARGKSDRLLARLGVLYCGSCGGRMVVNTTRQRRRIYPFYACPRTGDCSRRVTIGAQIAERVVTEAVKARYAHARGRASAEQRAHEAAEAAERAQADLDAAIRAFGGLEDEPVAVERLAELRRARDETQERTRHLSGLRSARTLRLAKDWDAISLAAKREIIRASEVVAIVGPGRGESRIAVHFLGQ